MRERWGLYVCRCGGELPLDEALLATAAPLCRVVHGPLGEESSPLGEESGPDAEGAAAAAEFAAEARGQGITRVLVGCCRAAEPSGMEALETAFAEAAWLPELHTLDLKGPCFLSHADPSGAHTGSNTGANSKALRMIRGEMRAMGRKEDVPENPLAVAGRILLVTDAPEGAALAPHLEKHGPLVMVLEGEDGAWDPQALAQGNRGHLTGVTGRLGKMNASIAPGGGNGSKASEPLTMEAAQVVVARKGPPSNPLARKGPPSNPLARQGAFGEIAARTGLHLVDAGDEAALASVPDEVAALMGTFMKPEHLRYDEAICAGGSSGLEACGRCMDHCPYDAVSRTQNNPLRIAVDHLACEGCGGCTAACPTGALAFTDPSPAQIYDRLAAMLAPLKTDPVPESTPATGAGPAASLVAVFHCPEQGRNALNRAEDHPWKNGAGLLPVEVPCLRHVSAAMMLAALRLGAAGVALLGCDDCVHGERAQMEEDLELTGRILDAFGLGARRVRLFTTEADTGPSGHSGPERHDEVLGALERFSGEVEPTGLRFRGVAYRGGGNREVMAEALTAIIDHTGREPGGLPLKGDQPFALAVVDEEHCTLCRSCANVCPSHAFRFDVGRNELAFKHIDCVACGLCEQACPEKVITLRRELYLEKEAMTAQVVAEDEMIHCAKCEKPYINRRALDTIEGRVLGMESLLDTFQGKRKEILRMCPDCRAVAAVWEVEQGWEP